MENLSYSDILVLILAAMLIWISANVLISIIKLNKTLDMKAGRYIYPASCKPEQCKDPQGFLAFITPRLVGFGVLGLLIAAFILVNGLTDVFASLPNWFKNGAAFFFFIPLFIWYVYFINKAAKKFW